MKNVFKIITCLLALFLFVYCKGSDGSEEQEVIASKPPVTGIRIAWDYMTLKKVSTDDKIRYSGYARMIQLGDKSLMTVYEADGNVVVVKSNDLGASWSAPVTVAPKLEGVNMAVPDILQLKDNSILICYNPRPTVADPAKRFGIRTIKSYDGGVSWKDDRLLYQAGVDFGNGCWEPSAIQLESGEIQLFFANEGPYTSSNEQNISMLKSPDGGLTWTETPEIASFRAGKRDGMPSPLILQNGKDIVFSIEDDGEGNFKPCIIRTSADNAWKTTVDAASPNRSYALSERLQESIYAGAPYLRQLKTGPTILSYQGTENRTNKLEFAEMKVVIGDEEARNFNRKSTPFIIKSDKSGLWNSISVLDDNTVVALTSTNTFSTSGNTEIWMIKGRVMEELSVANNSIVVDGEQNETQWNDKFPVFVGQRSATQSEHQFTYDEKNLYIISKVRDKKVIGDAAKAEENDGITVFIDAQDKSLELPGTGVYSFYLSANNNLIVKEGFNKKWVEKKGGEGILHVTKTNSEGYIQEVAIPWSFLGGMPPSSSRIGVNICLTEAISNKALDYRENISSNDEMKPYTWMTLKLNK
jgi:hypothetical protein